MKYYTCYLHLETNVPGQLHFSVAFLIKSVMVSNSLHTLPLSYTCFSHDQCEREACGDQEGRLRLNNGVMMPVLGLGTAGLTDQPTVSRAVGAALATGYRMIGEDRK